MRDNCCRFLVRAMSSNLTDVVTCMPVHAYETYCKRTVWHFFEYILRDLYRFPNLSMSVLGSSAENNLEWLQLQGAKDHLLHPLILVRLAKTSKCHGSRSRLERSSFSIAQLGCCIWLSKCNCCWCFWSVYCKRMY